MSAPRRHVLALVANSGNDILAVQSARFMERWRPLGLIGHVLHIGASDLGDKIGQLTSEGIAFAWGYAGLGCRFQLEQGSLWEIARCPFVSVLADPPFALPANHYVPSRWVVNGYVYRDWLDFQRRYIRGPQISGLVRMGVLPNPARDKMSWNKRPVGMAFIKTGGNPEQRRAGWQRLPVLLRRMLEEASAIALRQGTGDIVSNAVGTFNSIGLYLEERRELFFAMLQELDLYVREARATAIARALLPLPVEIHGDGWDHLQPAAEGTRAMFRPAFHASKLDEFFADCRWLVNSTPNFASGAHERVVRGFAAGCAVVSDENEYAATHLSGLPSFRGFTWNDADLTERFAAALANRSLGPDTIAPATAFVEREFSPDDFLQSMLELAAVATANNGINPFPPGRVS